MFLVPETTRANMGPTQPRIYWVMGVKRPERKAKHSSSPNAEIRNEWRYTSIPPIRHNDAHMYKCTFFHTEVILHSRQQITIPYRLNRKCSSKPIHTTAWQRDSQWRLTEESFLPLASKQDAGEINGGELHFKAWQLLYVPPALTFRKCWRKRDQLDVTIY